jgi:hypothetical protein
MPFDKSGLYPLARVSESWDEIAGWNYLSGTTIANKNKFESRDVLFRRHFESTNGARIHGWETLDEWYIEWKVDEMLF